MSNPVSAWFEREGLALLTDFYELTMMAGHLKEGRADQQVTFNYSFRNLPPHAGFGVFAGLHPFLDYVERLRFTEDDVAYLRSLNIFDEEFLIYLGQFRLTCDISAAPEGSLVFPHEPLIQVSGAVFETQLLETALLTFLNHQTLIATKAARICLASEGEPVIEFGLRRAHGPDGGVSGSRAAHIGGCVSTSNVLAGRVYGIPVSGTHAHSWVMSFPSELEAFRTFARLYPERCVLLVDTYDTLGSGVPNAIRVFQDMRAQGVNIRPAIRLDSGDLSKLSKAAHRMMIEAGLENPLIVASNDLDEDIIADLKRQGAKINAWGVGTKLITSQDHPSLNGVYKLVARYEDGAWLPRIKISSNLEKATDPGRKKLIRYYDAQDQPLGDILCQEDESLPLTDVIEARHRARPHQSTRIRGAARCEDLLQPVVASGKRVAQAPSITETRKRVLDQIAALPEEFKRLRNPEVYKVLLSPETGRLKEQMIENPDLA